MLILLSFATSENRHVPMLLGPTTSQLNMCINIIFVYSKLNIRICDIYSFNYSTPSNCTKLIVFVKHHDKPKQLKVNWDNMKKMKCTGVSNVFCFAKLNGWHYDLEPFYELFLKALLWQSILLWIKCSNYRKINRNSIWQWDSQGALLLTILKINNVTS